MDNYYEKWLLVNFTKQSFNYDLINFYENNNLIPIFTCSGISLGIYTTSSADAIKYILEDSNTTIVVVENTACLNRVLKVIYRRVLKKYWSHKLM